MLNKTCKLLYVQLYKHNFSLVYMFKLVIGLTTQYTEIDIIFHYGYRHEFKVFFYFIISKFLLF